jgi:tRNA-Thr(GGU) m(6)t(6)A37 methyltransferase TsaA
MSTIGIIHSPYKKVKDMPIQGKFKPEVKAWVELKKEYVKGLKDLDGFSHAIIIYYFHKSEKTRIEAMPLLEDNVHGIFAIRSPYRPNHIGFSIVKIEGIEDNKLYFSEVDVLDKTPVLDIKPYVKYFDFRENVTCGWVEKHFKDGKIPDRTILERMDR